MTDMALHGGDLPVVLTTFVGRRDELAEVRRSIGVAPLTTLTGIGGVGKTRLAFEVARQPRTAFSHGVRFVDLAPLQDPGLVAQAVAAALGMRTESSPWSLSALGDYLSDKPMLLLMDNCEHLVDACAVLVESLLQRAPDLRVLATSREPLGIPGEHVVVVPPLPVPSEGNFHVDAMPRYDAVALFLDRARSVVPGFTLDEDNVAAVSSLVQRLDGIPLALELAAARLRVLSPRQIERRLDDRYRLLSGGRRAAHPHQQSLQTLIDWSYDLCSPPERTLWVRLCVFSGDFDLEAAEEVCGDEQVSEGSVLDALTGLVDKSILVVNARAPEVRYRLPETLRDYGRLKWESAEHETEFRRRHLSYYQRLAERAEAGWFGREQAAWTFRIHDEYVNLRAALEFALTQPGEEPGIIAAAPMAMNTYWSITGRLAEAERLLTRIIQRPEPSRERAHALWLLAWIALNRGDLARSIELANEGREVARRVSDALAEATAVCLHAYADYFLDNQRDADAQFQEGLQIAAAGAEGPTAPTVASALAGLGLVATKLGDVSRAVGYFQQSIDFCEARGESWVRGMTLSNWAQTAWRNGDSRAGELVRESLRLRAIFPDIAGVASNLVLLARVEADAGHADRAARLLGGARNLFDTTGATILPDLAPIDNDTEDTCRAALGKRACESALRQGAQMSLHDLVSYALGSAVPLPPQVTPAVRLTNREIEVVELLAEGMSNREIAGRLVISQRTAEGHVEHILAKLGFTSRSQITAWCAEQKATAETATSNQK
jgi:predicted ATPase/DNA-binding CsgD family transcriptional regulator